MDCSNIQQLRGSASGASLFSSKEGANGERERKNFHMLTFTQRLKKKKTKQLALYFF